MEAKRVVFRKPVQTVTLAPTPNSAVQRKPIATPPAQHSFANDAHEHPCPHCGSSSPIEKVQERDRSGDVEAAQRRIADLEAEVKILNEKASNAYNKLADYEDEVRKLKLARERAPSPQPPVQNGILNDPSSYTSMNELEATREEDDIVPALLPPPLPQQVQATRPGGLGRSLTTTRITNFLAARRNSPASQTASPTSPSNENGQAPTSEPDLASRLLEAERAQKAAEKKLKETNLELEELSASLFQSANDMVANERRQHAEGIAEAEGKAKEREEQWQEWQKQVAVNERAAAARSKKLEEKVRRLEGRVSVLEEREKEKKVRLERLEAAMKRAARARGLLEPMSAPG